MSHHAHLFLRITCSDIMEKRAIFSGNTPTQKRSLFTFLKKKKKSHSVFNKEAIDSSDDTKGPAKAWQSSDATAL